VRVLRGLDRCAAGHVVGAPVSRYGWTHVGIAVGVGLGLGLAAGAYILAKTLVGAVIHYKTRAA